MADSLQSVVDRILGEEILPKTRVIKTRNGHEFEGGVLKADGKPICTKRSLHSIGVDRLEKHQIPKDLEQLILEKKAEAEQELLRKKQTEAERAQQPAEVHS